MMKESLAAALLTFLFPSSWIFRTHPKLFEFRLKWSPCVIGDGAQLFRARVSVGFLACQHSHLLLHPNQEITLVSSLTGVFWIWSGGIKATQGTSTWPLGPINAFANLNFSRPPLIFKRSVSSNSSALSSTTNEMRQNSIKAECEEYRPAVLVF